MIEDFSAYIAATLKREEAVIHGIGLGIGAILTEFFERNRLMLREFDAAARDAGRLVAPLVFESPMMTTQDWSGCRSPSRARRRLKMGHPQRVVERPRMDAVVVNGTAFMHPVTAIHAQREVAALSRQKR